PPGNRFAENPLTLQHRGHRGDYRPADVLPLALVIHEEERAIPHQWASEGTAELIASVLGVRGVRRLEEIARVERLVPQELESCPMPRVGTALRRQVDDAAVEAPELRGRTVAFNL